MKPFFPKNPFLYNSLEQNSLEVDLKNIKKVAREIVLRANPGDRVSISLGAETEEELRPEFLQFNDTFNSFHININCDTSSEKLRTNLLTARTQPSKHLIADYVSLDISQIDQEGLIAFFSQLKKTIE